MTRGPPPNPNKYANINSYLNAVRRHWSQGSSKNTPVNVNNKVEEARMRFRKTPAPAPPLKIGLNVWGLLGHKNMNVYDDKYDNFLKNLPKEIPKPNPKNSFEVSNEKIVMSDSIFAAKQFTIKTDTKFNLDEIEKKAKNYRVQRGGNKYIIFRIQRETNKGLIHIVVTVYANGTIQVMNTSIEMTNDEIKNIISKIIGRTLVIDPKKVRYISKFCTYIDDTPQQIDLKEMLEFIRSFYRKNQTKFNSLIKISNRNVEALTEVPVKTKRLGSVHASNLGIPVTEAGLPIPQEKKYFYVDGKLIRIRIKLDDGKEVYLIISYTGLITAILNGEYTSGPKAFKKLIKTINITEDIFENTNTNHMLRGLALSKKQRAAHRMQMYRSTGNAKNANNIKDIEKKDFYVRLKLKTLLNGNRPVYTKQTIPNKSSNSFLRNRGKLLSAYKSWDLLNLNKISKHTRNVWNINKNVIQKFKETSVKSAAQSAGKRKKTTNPSGILPSAANWIKKVFKSNGTAEILKTSKQQKRELYYPSTTPGKTGEYGLLPAGNITKKKDKFIAGLKAQGGRIKDLPQNVKNALKLSNTPGQSSASSSNSNSNSFTRQLKNAMLASQNAERRRAAESAERKRAAASAERRRAAASAERRRAAASAERKRAAASAERRRAAESAERKRVASAERRAAEIKRRYTLQELRNIVNKVKRKREETARLAAVSAASRPSVSLPNNQYGTMFGKRKRTPNKSA